ncbi:MAG TPA: fluoride efflux transporter CrcB [Phycisphaerales bacterium]|nr:fluoride efflux transporter CrcB [Phycisphaerales bacterium]
MARDAFMRCFAVALGGALGSVARYGLSLWGVSLGGRLPWGTLAANGGGCLAMGAVMYLVVERSAMPESVRLLLAVGFLGGLTTFSTFSYEVLALARDGRHGQALLYLLLSAAVGIGGAGLGWLGASLLVRGPA